MTIADLLPLLPSDRPVSFFLRHAERDPILDPTSAEAVLLTPAGLAEAEALGAALARYPELTVRHSPVTRCRQTAERLVAGAAARGARARLAGADSALAGPYFRDARRALERARDVGDAFVREWFDGRVSAEVIEPLPGAAAGQLGAVVAPLAAGVPGAHAHVSHDWNVMTVIEHYFGMPHERRGWAGFLDGVAAWVDDGTLVLRCDEETRRVAWPLRPLSAA